MCVSLSQFYATSLGDVSRGKWSQFIKLVESI